MADKTPIRGIPLRYGRLSLCLLLMASACSSIPDWLRPSQETEELAQELRDSVSEQYPQQFRAVHRSVLTVRHRQFNLDGYLRVDREAGFRILVSAGFGTTMFELAFRADGELEVIRNSGMLDDSILLAGPTRDLMALFFEGPSPSAKLSAPTADTWALTDYSDDGIAEVYRFDRSSHHLLEYSVAQGRRILYDATFSDFAAADAGGYRFPRRIKVTSRKPSYKIEIQVVEMRPDDFDAEAVLSRVEQ